MELWRELYAKFEPISTNWRKYRPTDGGWFKKEIESLEDLKGLKMRIPGLGGEVMKRLGVNPILIPAGEIYTALERGTIDATEWVGPALDILMGFDRVAKFYYKGWHEPGSILEITFNKARWDKLSSEHKAIIETSSDAMTARMVEEFRYKNAKALQELIRKGVEIKSFPDEVVREAKEKLNGVLVDESKRNPDFKRVLESYNRFVALNSPWSDISTKHILEIRG